MSKPLTVVFVDNSFTFGGAITSLAQLAKGLRQCGVKCVILSGQDETYLEDLFQGCATYSIPLKLPWVHDDPFLGKVADRSSARDLGPLRRTARTLYWFVASDLWPATRIARIARKHRADVIHLNNGSGQLDGAMAARFLNVPLVAHLRGVGGGAAPPAGSPPWTMRVTRGISNVLRRDLAAPELMLAVSGFVRENVVARGVPEARVVVVHDAIDASEFVPGAAPPGLGESLGIPAGALIVGHFGRVIPWKGTLEFVNAFALVARHCPTAHALVVGDVSDGPPEYERLVQETVAELGLADRVSFAGFRLDVPELMRLCDVVAHTSTSPEPFGMVIAEAMATATPVVAANAGGPLEILTDGEHGFLADPTDARTFAAAITTLLTDEALRSRMGEASLRRATSYFSKERYAADVMAAYERVLGRTLSHSGS